MAVDNRRKSDLCIDGEWRTASDGAEIDVLDPASEQVCLGRLRQCRRRQGAVEAADRPLPGWAATLRASAPRSCANPMT